MSAWWDPWWTDSHVDLFTRNVLAVRRWGVSSDSPNAGTVASEDSGQWASNSPVLPWPDADQFLDWLAQNNYPLAAGKGGEVPRVVLWSLNAAIDEISNACQLPVLAVEADGVTVKLPWERAMVPHRVFMATLLLAQRLYDRRNTSEGIQGASELGGTVRWSGQDSDIARLLRDDIVHGLA